jgi:hypothetical protein
MSEHVHLSDQQPRHWARWVGLFLITLAVATVAASCRSREAAPAPAAGTASPTTSTGQPAATESSSAPATDGAGEATASAVPDAGALGFSFASAPASPGRPADEVGAQNKGCVACHTASDTHTMHATDVGVSCVDCHGGNWDVPVPANFADNYDEYERFKKATHVQPHVPEIWQTAAGKLTAANPEISGASTLEEHQDFIRFVNPGDLRAAEVACGACHNTPADNFLVNRVRKNMMTHGGMLWGAASYNNGTHSVKDPLFGEFYTEDGEPARVIANPRVTRREMREQGRLPQMWPLPRWEVSQPGNILRVFERGGRLRPQIALPNPNPPQGGQAGIDDPGRPEVKLSVRGFGTDVRTDPVLIGLQKTRLMDPTLNFMGTNNHPGDYRASGCSACHVVYANDRSPVHSAMWSKYGNRGESFSKDPTVNPKGVTEPSANVWGEEPVREAGHPIQHTFVRNAPNSNCMTCHMHPGTLVLNSYLGYMWWDNESDGAHMYPRAQKYPSADDHFAVHQHNPEGSAVRGLWSNRYPEDVSHAGEVAGPDFLGKTGTPEFNAKLKNNHFADFHGHGWIFRAVFKQDRKGNLLDHRGNPVEKTPENMARGVEFQWKKPGDSPPDGTPVHLKDIHLERGMHCVDCHFEQDSHGDGHLYGETRNATMINCEDCHGTTDKPAPMFQYLSLPSRERSGQKGQDLLFSAFTGNAAANTKDRKAVISRNKRIIERKFQFTRGQLVQKAQLDDNVKWVVDQTADTTAGTWAPDAPEADKKKAAAKPAAKAEVKLDTTDPDERRALLARFAHTVRRDGKTWGGDPTADQGNHAMQLAHGSATMSCYACHTSWNTSCFGCHLPQRANQRRETLHNEGQMTRNYTNYNFQTLRDDVFMLGVDGSVKGNKIVPVRSACAVMVSSQDALRQWIYPQQQTVSAEGFSGTAFSPYFPHTVRAVETKQCSDCHISAEGDNNAIMAQVLLQGTNSVNFIGRFAWVAMGDKGLEAVAVTERDEPQAVIGSKLHSLAYPDFYKEHQANHKELKTAHEHHGVVLDLVQRGEYVYTAGGPEGFRAYDIASIDNKGFSERIVTAPVSPVGQRFKVDTKYATSVTTPSTMAIDPTRPRRPENEEGPIHLMYAFLYVTDREEGLVIIGNPLDEKRNKPGVATLLDGDPSNNFLKRAYAFNPDGLLTGAQDMEFYGTLGYVTSNAGIVVIDFDNPLEPKVVKVMSEFNGPRRVQFQFRYGFVIDNEGLKVIDVTDPREPKVVPGASVAIGDARDVYLSRTYAYVAAGNQGLVIVDVTKPEHPALDQTYDADGHMNDATAVKVGMTNTSLFAYVADGRNGIKVIQLTDEDTPGYMGFSPRPTPRLIAEKHTHGPALAIGEGLDRDRAVDESGNQLSVFGRRGARPFNREEQARLFLMKDDAGNRTRLYTVRDFPETQPLAPPAKADEAGDDAGEGERPGPRRPGRRGRGPARPGGGAEAAPSGEAAPAAPPRRRGARRPGGAVVTPPPADEAPAEVPAEEAPAAEAPAEQAPAAEEMPAEAIPAEAAPAEGAAPAEETPAEEMPADEAAPAEELPAGEVPTDQTAPPADAPAEAAPADAPAEESPAEESSAEDAPAEAPADEAPAAETPAEDAPTGDAAPAEAAPSDEAPAEDENK